MLDVKLSKTKIILKDKNSGNIYEFSFAGDNVVRFKNLKKSGGEENEQKIAVSVPELDFDKVEKKKESIKAKYGSVQLDINLKPFSFRISNSGRELFSTLKENFLGQKGKESIYRFGLSREESIYGGGQDYMERLSQRGFERRCWHQWNMNRRSGNDSIPFFLSTKGYGIFVDTTWPVRFDIGGDKIGDRCLGDSWAPSPWGWESGSGEKDPDAMAVLLYETKVADIYIIAGKNFNDIIKGYYAITGAPKLLPKWAYGFIQCKNRYRSEKELLFLADKFKNKRIPADVLVIDWLWFKQFGDMEWDKANWPDPKKTFDKLSEMGFKIMQAQHPFIEKDCKTYNEFEGKGFLNKVPENIRPSFDHSNPQARKAWWEKVKALYQTGVKAYWTDMGELEVHAPGTTSFIGSREKFHNAYTYFWTKGLFENQTRDFGTRLFSLARTYWSGVQAFGAAFWSGDIESSWEVFKGQVKIGQCVTLSGIPFWCTDIGGFAGHSDLTPELYVRWFQWGTFCPIFRTHGTRAENEPWSFGEDSEKILAHFIRLRYMFMPYIYSLASETRTGKPMMRAMVVDYPRDTEAMNRIDQFMFGDILISPVIERGERIKETYLPEGLWYDFWNKQKHQGKNVVTTIAPMERIPMFVKAGAIIPEAFWFEDKPLKNISVKIYSGADGKFEVYEDDNATYGYEKGEFSKIKFSTKETKERLVINISSEGAGFKNLEKSKKFLFTVFGINAKKIKDGDSIVKFDNTAACVSFENLQYNLGEKKQIIIDKKDTARKDETLEIFVDSADRRQDWKTYVYVTLKNGKDSPVRKVHFQVTNPDYWHVTGSNLPNGYPNLVLDDGKIHMSPSSAFKGELCLTPIGDAMQVYSELKIKAVIETERSKEEKEFVIKLDSGELTGWKMAGIFDSPVDEIEKDTEKAEYKVGDKTYRWVDTSTGQKNIFGYLDLFSWSRTTGNYKNLGYAYAKIEIVSDEDKIVECSLYGEDKLEFFLNGMSIYSSQNKVLEDNIKLQLRKGANRLLAKVYFNFEKPYSGREFGFKLKFSKPDKGILIR